MRKILLFIGAASLCLSAYSQSTAVKNSSGGKRNSVKVMYNGRRDRHIPTEGDGTGDKVMGEKTRKLNDALSDFIKKRQKFASRKYRLKTGGGAPIKGNR